jgi:hypothetical protein
MSKTTKTSLRVEFDPDDWKLLVWLSNNERLPKSEIIRRATRDAYRRMKGARNSKRAWLSNDVA